MEHVAIAHTRYRRMAHTPCQRNQLNLDGKKKLRKNHRHGSNSLNIMGQ